MVKNSTPIRNFLQASAAKVAKREFRTKVRPEVLVADVIDSSTGRRISIDLSEFRIRMPQMLLRTNSEMTGLESIVLVAICGPRQHDAFHLYRNPHPTLMEMQNFHRYRWKTSGSSDLSSGAISAFIERTFPEADARGFFKRPSVEHVQRFIKFGTTSNEKNGPSRKGAQ